MRRALFVLLMLILVMALVTTALANGAKPKPKPAPKVEAPPPISQPSMVGMGPAVCTCSMNAVAVDTCSVYVLNGNTLTRYNKTTMTPANSVTLPPVSSTTMSSAGSSGQGPSTDMSMSSDQYTGNQQDMNSQPGMMGAGPSSTGMMHMMGSIAVDDSFVYVVQGNQVTKIDKNTLNLITTTALAPMTSTTATQGAGPDLTPVSQCAQDMLTQMSTMSSSQLEQAFMKTIIQNHVDAIAWSHLAQTKASSADLRDFAQKVATDEGNINVQFSSWLSSWYNISIPATPTLDAAGQQTISSLQSLSGSAFDTAYMQAMISHFRDAYALATYISPKATHTDLAATASSMAQKHIQAIQQLQSWLAGS